MIVAVAENGVIGSGGKLPWHLADDLRRFKQLTMGHTIIMGRRTWESIGRPLPGRHMIVVSRQRDYQTGVERVHVVASLEDALQTARADREDEAFIIGGAELYREALPRTDRMYLTRVRAQVAGDTYLPAVNWSDWRLMESHPHAENDKNDYAFDFQVYERARSDAG